MDVSSAGTGTLFFNQDASIDMITETMTAYISFCVDLVIPQRYLEVSK